jgi:hypothetical protein
MGFLDEACALKRRMGDPLGAANSEQARALILLARGQTGAARTLLTAILDATGQLGERLARAHYLDSLAMVDLADHDPRSAQRHLAEAAALSAEVDNPSLAALIGIHRALALLAAGDLGAAVKLSDTCAERPASAEAGVHAAVAIERAGLAGCLALAAGDQDGASAAATEVASRAAAIGDARWGEAAARITTAIETCAGGAPAAGLPRLLWVAADH